MGENRWLHAVEAVRMTEVFEYAKRLGAGGPSPVAGFHRVKLLYATWLAECGETNVAAGYCDTMARQLSDSPAEDLRASNISAAFLSGLWDLHERLCNLDAKCAQRSEMGIFWREQCPQLIATLSGSVMSAATGSRANVEGVSMGDVAHDARTIDGSGSTFRPDHGFGSQVAGTLPASVAASVAAMNGGYVPTGTGAVDTPYNAGVPDSPYDGTALQTPGPPAMTPSGPADAYYGGGIDAEGGGDGSSSGGAGGGGAGSGAGVGYDMPTTASQDMLSPYGSGYAEQPEDTLSYGGDYGQTHNGN
eukprot:UC1_evm1s615